MALHPRIMLHEALFATAVHFRAGALKNNSGTLGRQFAAFSIAYFSASTSTSTSTSTSASA